jgi:hypothetical protein
VFDFITDNGVSSGTPYTSKEGNWKSGPKVMAIVGFENVASNENSLMLEVTHQPVRVVAK